MQCYGYLMSISALLSYPRVAHSLLKQVHTAVLYDLYHTNVLYHWKIAKYVATDGAKH